MWVGKGEWIWEEFGVCKWDQKRLYEILRELLEIRKRISYTLNNDANPHLAFIPWNKSASLRKRAEDRACRHEGEIHKWASSRASHELGRMIAEVT